MEQRVIRPVCLVAVLVLAAVAAEGAGAARPASSGPEPGYRPLTYGGSEISLLEAVRLTLEQEPGIQLQRTATQRQAGLAQQATGQFDAALLGQFSFSYTQTELTAREKNSEVKKRTDLQKQADDAGANAAVQGKAIGDLNKAKGVFTSGGNPDDVHFDDPFTQKYYELLVAMWSKAAPGDKQQLGASIAQWIDANVQAAEKARADALQSQQASLLELANLGSLPRVNEAYEGSFSLQLAKQYRTGITLTPYLDVTGAGYGYKGKPNSEDYGGKGITGKITTELGFTVDIPLGRNRGVETTGAYEKAAMIDLQASRAALTHAASNSVFNTVVSYWSLAAAQERAQVLRDNLDLQNRLLELTQTLIQADEMPRAELARSQAAAASARAQVEDARRALHEARVTLARTIGFQVDDEAGAPLASEGFPPIPDEATMKSVNVQELQQAALVRRFDLKAASQLEASGRVLWRAATLNLRRQIDLQMKVSYGGLGESNGVTDGLRDAFGTWTGPSGRLGLNVNWPFANNTQRGLLEQQAALYTQSQISTRDLERLVKANVVLAAGSLEEAVQQVRHYGESVDFYRQTVDAEMERLRLGSATLIDTILTQQQLTGARLALVGARQLYAQVLAQLRFETGSLVGEREDGAFLSEQSLTTLPVPAAQAGR